MPCNTFPIDPAAGPLLDIGIAPALSLMPPGSAPPPIRWIKAVADTGCSHTAIHSGVALTANLPLISKVVVNSTTHSVVANVYLGDLVLRYTIFNNSYEFFFRDRPFTELIQNNPNYDALLGMDILGLGLFSVNDHTKLATFCW